MTGIDGLQNPCAPGRDAAESQHQSPVWEPRTAAGGAHTDLSSGGDEEVGLDFVQVWPCHSRRGLKLPKATGSLPGQGEILGLIMEHLKEPK